jgi:hypothetical protein
MRRRDFLTLLGGAAAAWPLAARAQQQASPIRPLIGMLLPLSAAATSHHLAAFRSALRDLGYDEGRNATLELRYGDGAPEKMAPLAGELVALKPDVLFAGGKAGALAAHSATLTIPIVIITPEDPVASGLANTIAKPGGNVTGTWLPAYRAAAKFIEKTRDLYPTMIYTNVSFVGSTALADELMLLGPRYANGVIVTQVVPAVDSYASPILKYKTALAKYFPAVPPDYVSLEGYVAGSVLLEGLKRVGPQLDTEKLVEGLENLRDLDMGLGAPISFGPTEHQGSHKVWGTQLDEHGRYQPIDLQ